MPPKGVQPPQLRDYQTRRSQDRGSSSYRSGTVPPGRAGPLDPGIGSRAGRRTIVPPPYEASPRIVASPDTEALENASRTLRDIDAFMASSPLLSRPPPPPSLVEAAASVPLPLSPVSSASPSPASSRAPSVAPSSRESSAPSSARSDASPAPVAKKSNKVIYSNFVNIYKTKMNKLLADRNYVIDQAIIPLARNLMAELYTNIDDALAKSPAVSKNSTQMASIDLTNKNPLSRPTVVSVLKRLQRLGNSDKEIENELKSLVTYVSEKGLKTS